MSQNFGLASFAKKLMQGLVHPGKSSHGVEFMQHMYFKSIHLFSILPSTFFTSLGDRDHIALVNMAEEAAPPLQLASPNTSPSTTSKPRKRDISPSSFRKPCDLCHTVCDVLVRCRIDDTQEWHFVCTGKCWRQVSGGKIDGPDMPFYQYGGMWKNKHAGVSAKKPKKKKQTIEVLSAKQWSPAEVHYTTNDKVIDNGNFWICRRSHLSEEERKPGLGYTYWKEGERNNDDIPTQIPTLFSEVSSR